MIIIDSKRGISTVIATLLIVLLSFVFVAAIVAATLPFIKDKFSGVQSCLEAQFGVQLIDTRLSCYEENTDVAGFTVRVSKKGIERFRIALTDENGGVKIYDVGSGGNPEGFGMFGSGQPGLQGTQQIQIPVEGQQFNYLGTGTGQGDIVKVEVSPIARGVVCSVDDSVELDYCSSGVNLGAVSIIVYTT